MPDASYACTSFHGGEVSPLNQGKFDLPIYRTFLNVCLNGFPTENGSHTRRPGSRWAGTTRSGLPGRVIKFDVQQATPFQLEFTDNHLRFWQGVTLIASDAAVITAISGANPAVVNVTLASGNATGDQFFFGGLGTSATILQGRVFTGTRVDATHFSIADAVTGVAVDGATIGALAVGSAIFKVKDIITPYAASSWASLRVVQAETQALLLQGAVPPQVLQFGGEPVAGFANFTLAAASLLDGPYLDPFTNGAQVTPNQKTGLVTFTISFPSYVATTAYPIGAFVNFSSVNYVSLVDQNVGNQPDTHPSQWSPTSTNAAINDGRGFLGTDIGRLIRLYSVPAAWAAGSTYAASTAAAPIIVSYNPTGAPGAETFWQSLVGSNIGHVPGTDLTNWGPVTTGAALWTWGKITGLANQIAQATGTAIGTMTGGGGLAAAFDSITSQAGAACASLSGGPVGFSSFTLSGYVGKNYSGVSGEQIEHGTLYPSNDIGFATQNNPSGFGQSAVLTSLTINMRGKASAPVNAADGTLLGSTGNIGNSTSAVSIQSGDQVTAWNYVWFEIIATWSSGPTVSIYAAEAQFFNPPGTGSGNAITVELLGPALLYTQTIATWRLGAYSGTTGYPTCGCYSEHDGRLFLAGAIPNRVDGCVSNGIAGNNINFAPTDQNGIVTAANAITAKFNSDGVNPIFGLIPVDQGIIVGTQSAEWMIFAPGNGALSPTNIDIKRRTKSGWANVEPRQTEHTTIFVQRYGRKIIEYFSDVFSGKYTAPNLAEKAMHLTRNGIVELAYQQAVTPIIWARDTTGALRGATYKRDTLMTSQGPTFAGWHRHALGSGRVVESIAVGPSVGGNLDSLTMVTNDPATGIRFIEVITDEFDEQAMLTQAWYLDGATTGTSYSVSTAAQVEAPYGGLTVNGLSYLNGKTVQAWIAGLDCGLQEGGTISDFVVANGSIFVPFGDGISAGSAAGKFTAALVASFTTLLIVVGFTYNSDTQLVRPMTPQESGARTGPALGKKRRTEQYAMLLSNTGVGLGTLAGAAVLVGTSFDKLSPALFKQFHGSSQNLASNLTFSGVHWDTLGKTESDFDNMFCWRVTRPYPCNVAAVELFLSTKDK